MATDTTHNTHAADPTDTSDISLRDALRPRGPAQLEASEHLQAGATVLQVDGELDLLTAPRLLASLDDIIRKGARNVVLDLREAVFIDSAGLHVLLNARRRLARASRRLAIICEEGPVRRVIELARLVETLSVVSSFDEYERVRGLPRGGRRTAAPKRGSRPRRRPAA